MGRCVPNFPYASYYLLYVLIQGIVVLTIQRTYVTHMKIKDDYQMHIFS